MKTASSLAVKNGRKVHFSPKERMVQVKRKFLTSLLCGVALVSTLFTGCGQDTGTTNSGEQKEQKNATADSGVVELTVWSEAANHTMLASMVESFKQEYAGQAEFEITFVDNPDAECKNLLLGDIHNGADVFSFPDDQLSSLIAAGALMPVDNADEVKSANLEESISAASYNDTLYAYPYTADNGFFMYYNKDYFSESDVQSFEKMLKVAEKAKKKISMEFTSGWYMYAFFGNTGLEFGINEDGVTNYCNWNSKEGAIKGTDIAKSLLDITSSSAFLNLPDGDFPAKIKSGEVIAGISGVWNVISVKEAWGDDYGAVKLPTFKCAGQEVQMSSFTGYKMMGVNAYSKHPEWAAKLADWLTNEQNQTIRFEERNQGPSNIKASQSDAVADVAAIQAVIEQSQYGTLQRVGNNYWDACTSFAETILEGNTKNIKLQKLMDELVNGITASTVG